MIEIKVSDKLEIDPQIEESYAKFCEIKSKFNFNELLNEAKTRLTLIDRILFECLGWDKVVDAEVEPTADSGYIDYALSTTRRVLIVEAKKNGSYFDLPQTISKPKAVTLKSLLVSNDNLKKAIKQAAQYSQDSGVPCTIVTNGTQYVGFLGSRDDGLSPLEGRAIVFSSIEQIYQHYNIFWSLFSKEGIQSLNLKSALLSKVDNSIPQKLSSQMTPYPGTRHRNDLQTDLSILSEIILEDLLHDDLESEFLEECYCESGALSQYSLLARDIIKVRYYQESGDAKLSTQNINTKNGINPDFFSNALSRRPIILLGNVGVGKTTFIRHLIQTDPDETFKNGFPIYVNLGEKLILVEDVVIAITEEIKRILLDDYSVNILEDTFVRNVYKAELKLFRTGIYKSLPTDLFAAKEIEYLASLLSDRANHTRRSIDYLTSTGKNVTIFLDNIDQRSTEDQQSVYLVSQELASQTAAVVFVSLRPETFYRSNESGVLKAYHQRAFTINPPRIDLVLLKRLQFGLKLAQGDISIPRLAEYGIGKLEGLSSMLKVMINSITDQRGRKKDLMSFIDNFAAGNVRSAVDMVKEFLSSGHVDSGKIIQIEKEEANKYIIPLHEFLRAIIYGESEHYDPNTSPIKNVFDISSNDPKEYFLRIFLIEYLVLYSESASANKGFVQTSIIYELLQASGYNADQIDLSFYYCLRNELIESSISYVIKESIAPNLVRATTKGSCYISLLVNMFQYIDAIIVDTPIIDDSVRTYMATNTGSDIKSRLNRAAHFIEYLDSIYDKELRTKNDDAINNFWKEIHDKLKGEIEYIYSRQVID